MVLTQSDLYALNSTELGTKSSSTLKAYNASTPADLPMFITLSSTATNSAYTTYRGCVFDGFSVTKRLNNYWAYVSLNAAVACKVKFSPIYVNSRYFLKYVMTDCDFLCRVDTNNCSIGAQPFAKLPYQINGKDYWGVANWTDSGVYNEYCLNYVDGKFYYKIEYQDCLKVGSTEYFNCFWDSPNELDYQVYSRSFRSATGYYADAIITNPLDPSDLNWYPATFLDGNYNKVAAVTPVVYDKSMTPVVSLGGYFGKITNTSWICQPLVFTSLQSNTTDPNLADKYRFYFIDINSLTSLDITSQDYKGYVYSSGPTIYYLKYYADSVILGNWTVRGWIVSPFQDITQATPAQWSGKYCMVYDGPSTDLRGTYVMRNATVTNNIIVFGSYYSSSYFRGDKIVQVPCFLTGDTTWGS